MLLKLPPNISLFSMLGLMCVGAMWTIPFLYYLHAYPITTFYQEWFAALLGLVMGTWMLLRGDFWRNAEVPSIVLLPLGMAAIVVVQHAVGLIPYFEQTLLVVLYLLWAGLIITLGAYLRKQLGLATLTAILAAFLVLGTELNAALGIIQHFGWHSSLDRFLTARASGGIYGNIAQTNHYANYVSLGLVSLLLLQHRGWLNRYAVVALAVPLLFVLDLSGSRSSWLYLIWLSVMTYFWWRHSPQQCPPLRRTLLLIVGLMLMHAVAKLPWFAGVTEGTTSLDRLFSEVNSIGSIGSIGSSSSGSGSIRLYLWHESLLIFAHSPWLGVGFGQFAWHHFDLLPTLRDVKINNLYNNAHNLIFHLAAETGIAGLLVMSATLIPWLNRIRKIPLSPELWWGCALLSILGIHSLLEYPLWYAYFIGIAALLLGMLEQKSIRLPMPMLWRIPAYAVMLFGLASIQQLYENYRALENVLADRPASTTDYSYMARIWQRLAIVQHESVLRPYAELYLGLTMDASGASNENKLALCQRVTRFSPVNSLVYKQALLLASQGKADESKFILERALWSYPEGYAQLQAQLQQVNSSNSAVIGDITNFAKEKHNEYLSVSR